MDSLASFYFWCFVGFFVFFLFLAVLRFELRASHFARLAHFYLSHIHSPVFVFLRQVSLCIPGWPQILVLLPRPPEC
jgi:hypothetical protein